MTTAFDNRRGLLKAGAATAAVAAAGGLAGCATTDSAAPAKKIGRVIVIGGGYGGATAAKYINQWSNGAIEVYLIDRERNFVSCPISNLVLGGTQSMETITHSYAKLREKGIIVLNDEVTAIDPVKKNRKAKRNGDGKQSGTKELPDTSPERFRSESGRSRKAEVAAGQRMSCAGQGLTAKSQRRAGDRKQSGKLATLRGRQRVPLKELMWHRSMESPILLSTNFSTRAVRSIHSFSMLQSVLVRSMLTIPSSVKVCWNM